MRLFPKTVFGTRWTSTACSLTTRRLSYEASPNFWRALFEAAQRPVMSTESRDTKLRCRGYCRIGQERCCRQCTAQLKRRVFLLTQLLLFVGLLSDVAWGSPQLGIRSAQGVTETVRVPTVVEPWSATAVESPPQPARSVHRRGHFPGFKEAKGRANAARALAQNKSAAAIAAHGDAAPGAAAATTSGLVFDGPNESDTNFIPPDPILAAGPNHVVVLINSLMAVYDKSGNLQGGFRQFSTFFADLGLTGEIFDPRIIYDQTDNRFILTAAEVDRVNFTSGNVLIAVSQTSDPTGMWNKFAVNFKGRNLAGASDTFPDFPHPGPELLCRLHLHRTV